MPGAAAIQVEPREDDDTGVNPRTAHRSLGTLESDVFLTAPVMSSDDPILGTSLDDTVLSWNQAAEHLYGFTAGEMVGHDLFVLIPDAEPTRRTPPGTGRLSGVDHLPWVQAVHRIRDHIRSPGGSRTPPPWIS